MRVYSPANSDEQAHNRKLSSAEDRSLSNAGRTTRSRLGFLSGLLVVSGLLQLVLVAQGYASATADPIWAAVDLIPALLSLALAALLWYLRGHDHVSPALIVTAVVVAVLRAALALVTGVVAGQLVIVAALPVLVCAYAVRVILERRRELA